MTAAGAIKGNINAKVEAKRIARTQKLMANEGSYVLGYIANVQHQIRVSERTVMYIPRKFCRGVIACFSARTTAQSWKGCKTRHAGTMTATLRIRAKKKVLMYIAPLASDPVIPVLLSIACIENKTAPMAKVQRVATTVNTKKVTLKTRIWFADIETEP
jgi:hypothetical protein